MVYGWLRAPVKCPFSNDLAPDGCCPDGDMVAQPGLSQPTSATKSARRWGNRPAQLVDSGRILGAALQADGETRSVVTASSIRRRSAAWTILLDWTYRSRRRASALWMTLAES